LAEPRWTPLHTSRSTAFYQVEIGHDTWAKSGTKHTIFNLVGTKEQLGIAWVKPATIKNVANETFTVIMRKISRINYLPGVIVCRTTVQYAVLKQSSHKDSKPCSSSVV